MKKRLFPVLFSLMVISSVFKANASDFYIAYGINIELLGTPTFLSTHELHFTYIADRPGEVYLDHVAVIREYKGAYVPNFPPDGVVLDIPAYATNPDTKISYKVTAIGTHSTTYSTSVIGTNIKNRILGVIIPNTVNSIGDNAFSDCSKINSVIIPNSVTSIGIFAFANCNGLTFLTIPNSVTSIGNYAFYDCSRLATVNYNAESCTRMGSFDSPVFHNCAALATLNIGSDVKTIPSYAFSGCCGLTSITIPNLVTSIGINAFSNCTGLATVNFNAENCTSMGYLGSPVFQGCTTLSTLNIGSGVKAIPNYAFSGWNGLTTVTIPNSVTTIRNNAFSGCSGLKFVVIPSSITSIGNSVFLNCSGLTSITIPNSVTSIGNSAFSGCGLTSITIPNSVTSIGTNAFSNCSRLISVNFNAEDCTTMGNSSSPVFQGCAALATLTIGSHVKKIPSYAFSGCSGLTSIIISNSVTSIGEYVFSGCSGLASITIPNSITSIGSKAFSNCSGLTTVNFNAENCSSMSGAFSECTALTTLNIGSSVKTIPGGAFASCSRLTSIAIPNSVTTIEDAAFSGCSGLASITIPNSVTSIGSYAFSNCNKLTTLTIPQSVTTIGRYAFSGCSGLTTVNFNAESCTSMGGYSSPVFQGCAALTTLSIGNDVKSVPNYAFHGCSGLTTLNFNAENCSSMSGAFSGGVTPITLNFGSNIRTIPDGAFSGLNLTGTLTIPGSVTSIGQSAFGGCKNLTGALTIPNSVTTIGNSAFSGCSGFTSISLPNSVTSIGSDAFSGCSGLTSVTIPKSVTTIGSSAFSNCSGLATVNFNAENCTSMGAGVSPSYHYDYSVFRYCDALTTLTIGSGVKTIPDYAFYGRIGLTGTLTIPNSVTKIGDLAFYGCSGLTAVAIGSGVATFGAGVFGNCSNLTTVDFNAENSSRMGAPFESTPVFWGCTALTTVSIGNGVRTIPNYAFHDRSKLTTVTIPNSVTSIGRNAFSNCFRLTSVTIPSSVTTISGEAFYGCSGLTTINFNAENCTYMGSYPENFVFQGCTALTTLTIGKDVKTIPSYAFYNCMNLYNITSHAVVPPSISWNTFEYVRKTGNTLILPQGSEAAYYATLWRELMGGYHWVKYYAEGGTVDTTERYIRGGTALGIMPTPVRSEYSFGGWFTRQDGAGVQYTVASVINASVNLYAKWFATGAVTAVTVSPSAILMQKGKTQQFTANVMATGGAATTVTWTVAGNSSSGTSISVNGLLKITDDEMASALTVTATSTFDNTKNGTATVSVKEGNVTVSGTVAGAPAGTVVQLYGAEGMIKSGTDGYAYIASTTTNAAGYYCFNYLPPGIYIVQVIMENFESEPSEPTSLADGETANNINFTVDNTNNTVKPDDRTTGLETVNIPLALMYPNPTDGLFTLNFDAPGLYRVTITTAAGKVLLRQTVNDQVKQMNISSYPVGVYLLVIDDGKRQSTTKIVKR